MSWWAWAMEFSGDEATRAMLERAKRPGPEREALSETHGMVSLDRAPHQELRKHFGLAYSLPSGQDAIERGGQIVVVDCENPDD